MHIIIQQSRNVLLLTFTSLAQLLVVKVDLEMPHLPRGDGDKDDNLADGPPDGARVGRLGRVAERGLDFTEVSLLALDIGHLLVQLAQLARERVDRVTVGARRVSEEARV